MAKGIWYTYIENRIKQNKNFLGCITGGTGSGKTYSALRMAEMLDKDFNADRIVFTPKDFIDLLNSGTLKKGSVIVADEFGVSMNSRNWQSLDNQMMNFILQTFRSEFNSIVFFTSPDFAFIDVSARKLFHSHMMTMGINQTDKEVKIKPYLLQINQRTGDIYYKYLRFQVPGQQEHKLGELNVGIPSKELRKAYEIKKSAFTKALNEKIQAQLDEKELKTNKKGKLDAITENAPKNKWLLINTLRNNGKEWKEIAEIVGNNSVGAVRTWYKDNEMKYQDALLLI